MPQQATETPTADIQPILDPLQVDRRIKADVWDAWHSAKTPQDFQASFDKLNIPREAKAALWDAKFPSSALKPKTQRELNRIPAGAPGGVAETPEEQVKGVLRGTAVGVFTGLGVKPSDDPVEVVTGSIEQFGQGLKQLLTDTADSQPEWVKSDPRFHVLATVLDLIPNVIDKTATGLEQGMKDTYQAIQNKDWEAASEKAASTITQIAMLRGGRKAPEASLADKAQGVARKVTEAKQATRDAVVQTIKQYSGDLEKNKASRRATMEENMLRQREALTKIDREKIGVAEENRGIEAENKAQAEAVAKRGQMAQEVDQGSAALGRGLKELEHKVWKEANRRMDAVKPKGNPEAPSEALIGTVRNAEKEILQGVPENIKEFRRVLNMDNTPEEFNKLRQDVMAGQGMQGTYADLTAERRALVDSVVERWGGEIPESGGEPLTWGKLQSLKSRIDARLRNARGMNGDVKRALFSVRDAAMDEMGGMLGQEGQSPTAVKDWEAARAFYRQFKEDFHEPTGPSSSGSPVAKALDAVDPDKIRKPFSDVQSSIGNRGLDTLRKYTEFGGDKIATRMQAVLEHETNMERLPKEAKPKPLKQAEEVHQLPKRKASEPVPEKPTVDVRAASLKAVEDTARRIGRLNAWDARIVASSVVAVPVSLFLQSHIGVEAAGVGLGYVVTKYLLSNALEKPEIANWIANTPKSEIDALNRLPGREKVIVKAGLTELVQQASKGKKISVSRNLRSFFGPENVNRLVRAGIIAAATSERKPAQQLKDLKAIQERYSHNPAMPIGEEP